MKKYLLFIISFAVLFFLMKIGSDMLLTLLYTPNLTSLGTSLDTDVEFGNVSPTYILGTLLVATIAFFLSQIKKATI